MENCVSKLKHRWLDARIGLSGLTYVPREEAKNTLIDEINCFYESICLKGIFANPFFLKRSYMGQTSLIGTLRGPCKESVRLGWVKLDELSLGIKQTVRNIEFSVRPTGFESCILLVRVAMS